MNAMMRPATIYLTLRQSRKPYANSLTVGRMTKSRPALADDEIAIRVRVTVPVEAFAVLTAELVLGDTTKVIVGNVEVEDEPQDEVTP